MKKKIFFLFVVIMLRGSPQSIDIDTLCYLHDATRFVPEYTIAGEIFNIHTKFYQKPNWQSYKILELHLLFRPSKTGDTIQSISFYKDKLQQLVFTHSINKILDSTDVYPNWFKIIIDIKHQSRVLLRCRHGGAICARYCQSK